MESPARLSRLRAGWQIIALGQSSELVTITTFCLIFCRKITCCLILVLIVYVLPQMTASLLTKVSIVGRRYMHYTWLTCRLAATYDSVDNITVDLRRNW